MIHDVCVIGAGPAGYVAAIRAAQLGAKVVLVEKDQLGGICLNWGCIPTKVLVSCLELFSKINEAEKFGIDIKGQAQLNFSNMMARKDQIVQKLRSGIEILLKARKIEVLKQKAVFVDEKTVIAGDEKITAKNFILATGSSPAELPFLKFDGENILTSSDILSMKEPPKSILIIGGGVIGCEYASILSQIGTEVAIIEMLPNLLPGEDKELGKRLEVIFTQKGIKVLANTMVQKAARTGDEFIVETNTGKMISAQKILVSIGRKFNTQDLGLEKCGVRTDKGEIAVDQFLKTNVDNIYSAGDVKGGYLLAHVASYEGIVASENILGHKRKVDYKTVPSCIYTSPEIASVGLTQDEALAQGYKVKVGKFPFQALGKAQILGQPEGFVKLIADEKTDKILGAQILGPHATDLIAEISVAIKAGLSANDLSETIHAHPTLPEAIMEAAAKANQKAIHIL